MQTVTNAELKLAADLQLLSALIIQGYTNSRAAGLVRRSIQKRGVEVFGRVLAFDVVHGMPTFHSMVEVDRVMDAKRALQALQREEDARQAREQEAARAAACLAAAQERERAEQERVTQAYVEAQQFAAGVTA